jgi:hypothetical protein
VVGAGAWGALVDEGPKNRDARTHARARARTHARARARTHAHTHMQEELGVREVECVCVHSESQLIPPIYSGDAASGPASMRPNALHQNRAGRHGRNRHRRRRRRRESLPYKQRDYSYVTPQAYSSLVSPGKPQAKAGNVFPTARLGQSTSLPD